MLVLSLTGALNALYIQPIGSGMVFYSDLILQSTLLSSAFWKVETFPLSSSLYSSELLNERLEYFWFKFIKKLSKEYKVYLLIKLKFDDDSYKAINSLIITTSEEFDIVKHILNKGVYKALAQYSSQQVTHLIFNYRIELDSENIINTNTLMFEKKSNLNTFTFKGPDFPLNIDHRKWGEIIYENEQDTIISIPDTKYTMIITIIKLIEKLKYYLVIDLIVHLKMNFLMKIHILDTLTVTFISLKITKLLLKVHKEKYNISNL